MTKLNLVDEGEAQPECAIIDILKRKRAQLGSFTLPMMMEWASLDAMAALTGLQCILQHPESPIERRYVVYDDAGDWLDVDAFELDAFLGDKDRIVHNPHTGRPLAMPADQIAVLYKLRRCEGAPVEASRPHAGSQRGAPGG